MINISSNKRDLLFLALLIIMIKVAINRPKEDGGPILYAPAEQTRTVKIQEISLQAHNNIDTASAEKNESDGFVSMMEAEEKAHAFAAHQPNEDALNQVEIAQKQIALLIPFIKPTTKQSAQLQSMRQRLIQLKKELKNTSPAIALLGPIGTTGIVLKENEIEKNLLKIVNMIRTILQTITDNRSEFEQYTSIAKGIEENELLLASIAKEASEIS